MPFNNYILRNIVDFAYYGHGYCEQPLIADIFVGTEFLMDNVKYIKPLNTDKRRFLQTGE